MTQMRKLELDKQEDWAEWSPGGYKKFCAVWRGSLPMATVTLLV